MNGFEGINVELIAPCGLNCALCRAYQRKKNNCSGCNTPDDNKPWHCQTCRIKYCDELAKTESHFCFSCRKYPCTYLKQMDARYINRYGLSVLQNLQTIKTQGVQRFLEQEIIKWPCKECGSLLCVHTEQCLTCGGKNDYFPVNMYKEKPAATR